MALVRFDPFRELATMQDRVNRIFGEAYGRRPDDDLMMRGDWLPPVDIFENEKGEIVLRAELPGLSKEDIDLRVENNTLTIRGERRKDIDVKDEKYHRVERTYGTFTRSFSVPNTVDAANVSADYKNGVLTVVLPVKEEAKPRQIQVKVNG
ncbi:MAG: Hsp20/alpha crystallin family protein [Vicinamibacterales bacterium]